MANDLPTGTVTFLFTDIEGSTQLWERHPVPMQAALARHDALLRKSVEANNGQVIKSTGDGLHAVFASAGDAASAVVAGQRALQAEAWPETGPLRVRMALPTGEADLRDGDYFGPALNRTARLMAVAAGGQSLVSQTTAAIIQDRLPALVGLQDLGEHCLKDLVRPERVFQVVAPDLPGDFPRLKSLNAFPHNLPVQLTSFVGREQEIAETRRLLTETHLLTLTGPGGTGKTRLALQIAAEVLPDFPDGAWLIELAPLADPAYLMPALAATFGLREVPGRSLAAVVTDYLRAKELVLLVDNCEHLIDACARLADELLHAASGLRIIATSREALGLAGEIAYRVPSLSLPDLPTTTPASLARSEAARLFLERAQAAQPRFALTPGNAPAIAAICARLDGIPLALELAAARLKVLTVEQIAARLDDRFRLLVGGSRTALPRQQTLRALIDWSYDLLSEDERRLLRELSVFAGGTPLEAAEAVCAGLDVLGVLTQLVNKSLVAVDEQGAEARYRLLETIRQYAREKLLDAGEAQRARDRHLEFFLQWTEATEPRLFGAEMIVGLDRLETEQDNLRAALEWALDPAHGDPVAALRLVAVLYFFWARRSSVTEGRQWVQIALARAEAAPHAAGTTEQAYLAARARALVGAAALAFGLGENAAALETAEASLALARQIDAPRTLAMALGLGATIRGMLGEVTVAQAWADESLALCRQYGFNYELGLYSGVRLFLAVVANEPAPPNLREEMLRAARATGNPWAIALAMVNVARASTMSGDYEAAHAGLEEAATLSGQIGDRAFYNGSRSEIGHVLRRQGRYAEAAAIYAETLPLWQALGQQAAIAHELECLAYIAAAGGQGERAARLFGAAEALRESTRAPMTAYEHREYIQALAQLRALADEGVLNAAWAKGRTLTQADAVQYALG